MEFGKAINVFFRFLALGCVSFGGPAAHIGYFRKTFVEQLGWLDQETYGRLVSLCQLLPGPGSSQTGFAIGCRRAGVLGGMAAFLGFTLPSFLLLWGLSVYSFKVADSAFFPAIVHGLKLLAVVVVADATARMYSNFCDGALKAGLCAGTAAVLLIFGGIQTQMILLGLAALIGMLRFPSHDPANGSNRGSIWTLPLLLFFGLFICLPFLKVVHPFVEGFARFYQTGSLVFGGGHVVLPLLQGELEQTISTDRFLLGYAAAQAVPGPMFSIASFLGAEIFPETPLWGAMVTTLGIFLPGLLLVLGLQKGWDRWAAHPRLGGAIAGVNAAVVGLLLAALYRPVFSSAVESPVDMAWVVLGVYALRRLRLPVFWLVILFAGIGLTSALGPAIS